MEADPPHESLARAFVDERHTVGGLLLYRVRLAIPCSDDELMTNRLTRPDTTHYSLTGVHECRYAKYRK